MKEQPSDLATIKRGFLVPTIHHTLKRQYHLQQQLLNTTRRFTQDEGSYAQYSSRGSHSTGHLLSSCDGMFLIVYAYYREEVMYFIGICPLHRQWTQCAPVQPTTFSTATGSVSVHLPQQTLVATANHGTAKSAGASSRAAIGSAFLARSSISIHALVSAHHARQVKLRMWTALVAFSPFWTPLSRRGLCHKGPVEISKGRTAS